jgi:TRAP-type C4-dicarboxylate transport system permease small subunit
MRAHKRRAVEEEFDDDETPSFVEFVVQTVLDPVVRSTVGQLKRGVRTAVEWTVQRLVAGGVVTGILIAGIILVLLAGVKGLEALRCPLWLCYLSMGVVAVIGALLLLKRLLSPASDDEVDVG